MKKKEYTILFIIISIIIFNSVYILSWRNDSKRTNKINNKLKEISKDVFKDNSYDNDDFLKIDFTKLLKENEQTIGWINIKGTNIDYAVVQAEDNKFYLNHSFDKKENNSGWLFLDYRNNILNLSKNTIIYGHARKDGSMFGTLNQLLKDNDKTIIQLSTLNFDSVWQIFSVYSIHKETYYLTTNFINNDSYQNFLNKITARSVYNYQQNVSINDKILTLSTCKDNFSNRIVVHAKLIKKEP